MLNNAQNYKHMTLCRFDEALPAPQHHSEKNQHLQTSTYACPRLGRCVASCEKKNTQQQYATGWYHFTSSGTAASKWSVRKAVAIRTAAKPSLPKGNRGYWLLCMTCGFGNLGVRCFTVVANGEEQHNRPRITVKKVLRLYTQELCVLNWSKAMSAFCKLSQVALFEE